MAAPWGLAITPPAGPGVIERTDNVKTALTQLAQQASSSGKAIKSLTWRMNSGAGFLPMALLKAEPGATVRVEMMEGGWSSGEGWITRLTRAGLSAQTATIRLELTAAAEGQA